MVKRKRSLAIEGAKGFKHKCYDKTRHGLRRCFLCICPMLSKLLFSKRSEYRGVKAMFGFPVGLLFGYALHLVVLERLQMTDFARKFLGGLLALCLAIGYAVSVQVRCICWLVIPTFCGRTGRAYISTYVISHIITGPVFTIMYNAQESIRCMACVSSLSINHTVERFKLMYKPVKGIIKDFIVGREEIQTDTKKLDEVHKPINDEVRDKEEVKKDEADSEELDREVGADRVSSIKDKFKKYRKGEFGGETEGQYGIKSEMRCEKIFTDGIRGCRSGFKRAEDNCYNKLPLIGYLLCWPMKLTFICNIAQSLMGKRSCDSQDAMSPGFGESIDTADGVQSEFDKNFNVQMQYKMVLPDEQVDQLTPEDVGTAIDNQFNIRKQNFEFLMKIVSRLLAFMFIQVFQLSRTYCNKYLRNIDFDNKYTTSYFRHIDARRKKQNKKTLLPLKKGEKMELTDPFDVRFSGEEKALLLINSLRLVGEVFTVSIILAFDWIFYEFLMLIQRHSRVEYTQKGSHKILMMIYGTGFLAKLVRMVLKGFSKKHTLDQVTDTADCLPKPNRLDTNTIIIIYVIFLVVWILMVVEAYGLRLRRVICGFFFPKREKKRVLSLYNDRLKKRKAFFRYMRRRVRKMARKQAISVDTGIIQILRHTYPKYFGWLEKLGLGKRKCLICSEVEGKKDKFIKCSENCPFVYCEECWEDIKKRCYVCSPDDEDSELSDDDEDDDDDNE